MSIVKIRQWHRHSLNLLLSIQMKKSMYTHVSQSSPGWLLCTTLCGAAMRRCHHCVFLDINSANKCIRLSGWLGLRQAWNVGKVWIYQKIVHFRGTAAASAAAATRRAAADVARRQLRRRRVLTKALYYYYSLRHSRGWKVQSWMAQRPSLVESFSRPFKVGVFMGFPAGFFKTNAQSICNLISNLSGQPDIFWVWNLYKDSFFHVFSMQF